MTEQQLFLASVLIGQILPVITDYVNKHVVTAKIRFWVSILLSVVLGALLNYNDLRFDTLDSILTSSLLMWTSGQVAYKNYYEGSRVQNNIRFSDSSFPSPL